MTTLRTEHTATLLDDGRVLIVGGYGGEDNGILAIGGVFDPATGVSDADRFDGLAACRPCRDAAAGRARPGRRWRDAAAAAEIYDPALGTFGPASSAGARRAQGSTGLPGHGSARGQGGRLRRRATAESIAILDLSPARSVRSPRPATTTAGLWPFPMA